MSWITAIWLSNAGSGRTRAAARVLAHQPPRANQPVGAGRTSLEEEDQKQAAWRTDPKQSGGAGQFAKVEGYLDPLMEEDFEFENRVTGGNIPAQFIPNTKNNYPQRRFSR